jgi:L-fuconolactonase
MTELEIVDAQVHTWEADNPQYPWDPLYVPRPHTAQAVPAGSVVAAMAAVGVDAAIIVTSVVYADNRYSLDAAKRFPGKFAVVGRINPNAPDLEERLGGWLAAPNMVGVRVAVASDVARAAWRRGEYQSFFAAAAEHDVPVCVFMPQMFAEVDAIARRHPDLQLLVDHLGLGAPPTVPTPADPFQALPELLALAQHPRVAVKLTGVPSFSAEAYPFRDTWPHVRRVVESFGFDRVMWGTDYTRVQQLHSYADGVNYIHEMGFSDLEKELIFGSTLRRLLRWPRAQS